jgi:hypothetical protein
MATLAPQEPQKRASRISRSCTPRSQKRASRGSRSSTPASHIRVCWESVIVRDPKGTPTTARRKTFLLCRSAFRLRSGLRQRGVDLVLGLPGTCPSARWRSPRTVPGYYLPRLHPKTRTPRALPSQTAQKRRSLGALALGTPACRRSGCSASQTFVAPGCIFERERRGTRRNAKTIRPQNHADCT